MTDKQEEQVVLTETERAVLLAMDDLWSDEFCGPFVSLQRETGLDRRTVRKACRSLAERGLARYMRGLFDDDGRVAGAGYGLTRTGSEMAWNTIRLNPQEGESDG